MEIPSDDGNPLDPLLSEVECQDAPRAANLDASDNFNGPTVKYCTWTPNQIEIGFEAKFQAPDTDTMVLGWGHSDIWRDPDDTKDYNQEILKYSSTLIYDKELCKDKYKYAPEMAPIIDHYMICTSGVGNIASDGRIKRIPDAALMLDGCGLNNTNSGERLTVQCEKQRDPDNFYGMRLGNFQNVQDLTKRRAYDDIIDMPAKSDPSDKTNGICQNDHGGPLVTWVGGKEMLIGVASVFIVDARDRSCVGPYLHTSTYCNGAFLNCVLKLFDEESKDSTRSGKTNVPSMPMPFFETQQMLRERETREETNQRYQLMLMLNRGLCDLPAEERGFDMIKRKISWMRHPDGPAENEFVEDLIERPQVPLRSYYQSYTGY